MNILAIADNFIPKQMMEDGLELLRKKGHQVTVKEWFHESIEKLQEDNLLVEQQGSEAIDLPQELLDDLNQFDIIITQFAPIGKKVIDCAKKLKVIGVLRGGIENVNQEYATQKGIKVMNTAGRNARAVAEFTVGLILAETRNIARTHAAMKKNIWLKEFPNGDVIPEIGGRTIGIIGFGNIGRLVAKFLNGFDANIIFYDPFVTGDQGNARSVGLDELIERSDIITVHGRLTKDTYHMIGKEHFKRMKDTAVLINAARSGLVDEQALIDSLQEGELMGAAIDTFDDEPLKKDSPFLTLNNVTITPHLAGSTADAFKNTPKLFAQRLLSSMNQE